MEKQSFTWNEENTSALVAAYKDAVAAHGCEVANSEESRQALAESIGCKNAASVLRKLVLEKEYQKVEKATTAKRETKTTDPLSWDEEGTKFAQIKELYLAKKEKDGILAANDTEWLNSIAATIGVKGAKAIVGKLAANGLYEKADTPRSVGGARRVPKVTLIRQMASKLEAAGFSDALTQLEPLEVANSLALTFLSQVVDKLTTQEQAQA